MFYFWISTKNRLQNLSINMYTILFTGALFKYYHQTCLQVKKINKNFTKTTKNGVFTLNLFEKHLETLIENQTCNLPNQIFGFEQDIIPLF